MAGHKRQRSPDVMADGTVAELVDQMGTSTEEAQLAAAKALANLAGYCPKRPSNLHAVPGLLSGLVILLRSSNHDVQREAARTLGNVSSCDGAESQREVIGFPDALSGLVALLESPNNKVQKAAVEAFIELAVDCREPAMLGTLNKLGELLISPHVHDIVKEHAARVLANMATDAARSLRIWGLRGVKDGLLNMLMSSSAFQQEQAARTLTRLSAEGFRHNFHNAVKIVVDKPEIVGRLVSLIESPKEPVQEQASSALANLASPLGNQKAFADVPRVYGRLFALLGSSSGAVVQENAARVLVVLTVDNGSRDPSIKVAVASIPGAVRRMLALQSSPNARLQNRVTAILESLAEDSEAERIIGAIKFLSTVAEGCLLS